MAYYLVSAKPKPDRLPDLLTNLQERAYLTIRPFGRSLTYSLENARLRDDGYAVWEEEDYCTPPLAQERAAALDEFFDDLVHCPESSRRYFGRLFADSFVALPRKTPGIPASRA